MLNKVTITGADDKTDIGWMIDTSKRFPFVEWGILVSKSQEGGRRFPSRRWIEKLVDTYLYHIWKMTEDRKMRGRGARGRKGRKRAWRGGFWGAMSRGEIPVDENGYPNASVGTKSSVDQALELGARLIDGKPKVEGLYSPNQRVRRASQTSSLDSILNPSRKYRLPEAE